jgi:hypothetical protein
VKALAIDGSGDHNGGVIPAILHLVGFSPSEILLLIIFAIFLFWKWGGRPPKAS